MIVHTGNIAIVPPSAGPTNCPKPSSLFAPRAVQLIGAQVRCKRTGRSCTKRKPCPECALSDHLDVIAKVPTGALVIYTDGGCDDNRKSRVTRTLRSTGAQAYDQKPAGWGFCVFEMAPGDSLAGLGRLKPSRSYLVPWSPMNRIHYSWALMDTQTTQGSSRQSPGPYSG